MPVAELFHALGDPVRCSIVEHLGAHREATVNELASLFPITLQAVSKHVKVLEAAGVITQRRDGRQRPVSLRLDTIAVAADWIRSRQQQLDARYSRLDELLVELQEGTPT